MPPSAKRRKVLDKVIHLNGVDCTTLSKVLSALDPEASTSREFLSRHVHNNFRGLKHIIKLPLKNGTEFDWVVADPGKLLAETVNANVHLQGLLQQVISGEPLSVILGFDEFIPGNKLAYDQSRKTMVVSFSFREYGRPALTCGRCWVTAGGAEIHNDLESQRRILYSPEPVFGPAVIRRDWSSNCGRAGAFAWHGPSALWSLGEFAV
jgi:hypothetical protein